MAQIGVRAGFGEARVMQRRRGQRPAVGRRRGGGIRSRRRRWRARRPEDPGSCAAARTWIRRVLVGALPAAARSPMLARVELVLTELVSNAVRHGGGVREVRVAVTAVGLHLAVRDNNRQIPVPVDGGDPHRAHGRGLQLVTVLTDRWGYRPCAGGRGKYVWADLTVSRAGR